MEEFLKKIVSAIVDDHEAIEFKQEENNGITVYTIFAPEEEIAKLIGKNGKTINAIRCLARLKTLQDQKKILIKIEPKV